MHCSSIRRSLCKIILTAPLSSSDTMLGSPKPASRSCYSTCTRQRAASPILHRFIVELLARPEVLGIKIATLDSVMTFQEIAGLVKSRAPGKLVITGEDRFLAYSLMCGGRAALIGMAAACTETPGRAASSCTRGPCKRVPGVSSSLSTIWPSTRFSRRWKAISSECSGAWFTRKSFRSEAASRPLGPEARPGGVRPYRGLRLARAGEPRASWAWRPGRTSEE